MVWSAARDRDGRRVAVKVGLRDDALLVERFQREAEVMAGIGPPHTPEVLAHGRLEGGRPYIVMERLDGETLAARLAALPGRPDLAWIQRVGLGLLDALAAVHARGVIHRDLKPENVFFAAPEDRVVLLDFGLTRPIEAESELTRSGVIVGTLEYMAPEQLRGDAAIDARADVYAAGVILYELCTLRPPFVGEASAIEHGHRALRPPRPGELGPVPRPLEDVILACLAKDPGRRPRSADELRRALADACARASASVAPGEASQGPPSGARPRLLAEGRLPVVVVVADADDTARVLGAVGERGGFVAKQRGARHVAVFAGTSVDDPARAALAAAREIAAIPGARAAIHLAAVTLRRRASGVPAVYGAAVDRPESWTPPEPWTGLVLTDDAARALPSAASAARAPVEQAALEARSEERSVDRARGAPLLGRDRVMEALAASAEQALGQARASLFTLVGEHGLGKTRLVGEASAQVARAHPAARVLVLTAAPSALAPGPSLAAELLGAILDAPIVPPDDPRAFSIERLGAEIGAATWEAVATLLGWRPGEPLLRDEVQRALAEGLRRCALRGPLAVILDDAHWADDAVLDALEYATLDGEGALWAMVSALPRFTDARPAWAARTRFAERASLEPLDAAASAELAARFLAPAEYLPAAVLERLARWSGGNPFSLAEIVRALKRAGIVRRRPGKQSYYVATAELDALPPSPAWQWLVARQLAALTPELAACVRLCSVLGASFSREELERVQEAVEAVGGASTPVDVGVGLAALVEEGVLERGTGDRFAFPSALLQDAVYEQIDPAQRREIHLAALAYWRARAAGAAADSEILEPLARHALAADAREEAADAALRLGDLAAGKHRHVEADQHYTAALAAAPEGDRRRRALALGGRGKCRVHIDRGREAVEDLTAAVALGREMGDDPLTAELLLEEATVRDWLEEFDRSAQRVDEARPLVAALGSPVLAARLLIADGRTCWRRGKTSESIDLLERGLTAAVAASDYSSRIIALLVLPWQLSFAGRLDDAEARFEEAIALATSAHDRPHQCVVYINRYSLWLARKDLPRALEDLQRAVALAREIGSPTIERYIAYNTAELLYLSGRLEEALALARRGQLLDERFFERLDSWGPLVLARIHLELGHLAEAQRLVDWVRATKPLDLQQDYNVTLSRVVIFRWLKLVLAELTSGAPDVPDVPGGWEETVKMAERVMEEGGVGHELLEPLYWRTRMALRGGRLDEARATLARAEPWLDASPGWRRRIEALAVQERKAGA